ncbi:DoxX family protein [Adhaeribacter radiodurans]|uniref:DoxX family protein n=1 Tax=Adhaeribacter radiodurans TaxID=2745197 RepID=A0A7L7L4S9_9BACT|nr:DoxX family protein [Adhaeribacter radiodurans]QMU27821.1 DoxX family protein [Adhaeribacter radiodurans]
MKNLSLYLMVLLYVGAGIVHFWRPKMYLAIMPPWLPYPEFLIFASGVCEVVFGFLLIPGQTRPLAAWLLIALLIAVFPANIQMALQYTQLHQAGWWLTWLRLPLQGVLIWWAYTFTK